jgi:hypothetical protein
MPQDHYLMLHLLTLVARTEVQIMDAQLLPLGRCGAGVQTCVVKWVMELKQTEHLQFRSSLRMSLQFQ